MDRRKLKGQRHRRANVRQRRPRVLTDQEIGVAGQPVTTAPCTPGALVDGMDAGNRDSANDRDPGSAESAISSGSVIGFIVGAIILLTAIAGVASAYA